MHIVLAILGAVVTILFYLNRLQQSGIDFGWLNPFSWNRRRKWKNHVQSNPLFAIDSPMETTACLMYAVAKSSGDISREQKQVLLGLFKEEFSLNNRDSTELLSSCSYLLKHDEDQIFDNLDKFLVASKNSFTDEQRESAFEMIKKVAECEETIADKQKEFISRLETSFLSNSVQKKWA